MKVALALVGLNNMSMIGTLHLDDIHMTGPLFILTDINTCINHQITYQPSYVSYLDIILVGAWESLIS